MMGTCPTQNEKTKNAMGMQLTREQAIKSHDENIAQMTRKQETSWRDIAQARRKHSKSQRGQSPGQEKTNDMMVTNVNKTKTKDQGPHLRTSEPSTKRRGLWWYHLRYLKSKFIIIIDPLQTLQHTTTERQTRGDNDIIWIIHELIPGLFLSHCLPHLDMESNHQ